MSTSNMEFNEIPYYTLFFSNDYSYMSGITSSEYSLSNNQDVYIQLYDDGNYYKYKMEITEIERRGYVVYNPSDNVLIKEDVDEFIYQTNKGVYFGNSEFLYDDKGYKHWCDNNIITIDGLDYEVDFELNSENVSITLENGTVLYLEGYNEKTYDNICNCTPYLPKIQKLYQFIIRKEMDYFLEIEDIASVDLFRYILIPTTDNKNKKLYLIGDDKLVENVENLDNAYSSEGIKCEVINYSVLLDGETYDIFHEWRNVQYSDKVNIYLGGNSVNKATVSDIINVTPMFNGNIWLDLKDDKYIEYFGKAYFITENETMDYILYNDHEYELFYEDDKKERGYILFNDKPMIFSIDGYNAFKKDYSINTNVLDAFIVNKYDFIEINGTKYIVKIRNHTRGVEIDSNKIQLVVEEVKGSNCLICGIIDGNDVDATSDITLMKSNFNSYKFELFYPLFDFPNPSTNIDEFLYHFNKISLFNPNRYYTLPLKLDNKTSNNLHQEYLAENFFFYKEIERSINRVVDMEKDIYYPYSVSGDVFSEINEIIFDLHFRTRNMGDWSINEDNNQGYMCNWNILDNYKLKNGNTVVNSGPTIESDSDTTVVDDFLKHKPIIQMSDNMLFNYYQPSDLLYFLNFTDKDVYYQKEKVGRSFLRLSFYDSDNPQTQTLLHTSSIFINEGDLYKKYIDNRYLNQDNGDYFITMDYEMVDGNSKVYYDSSISVKDEYYTKNKEDEYKSINDYLFTSTETNDIVLKMDESKRLSSQIRVKNRYESTESSEGFYLYMFKEYSDYKKDKDIYLKIEFNHAGTGRVINFFMPTVETENGEKELMNFSNIDSVSKFKEGIELKNLYKTMFIKMTCSYDKVNNIYRYYLPENMVKHDEKNKMRFNLYEIKIKDEIIYNNETNKKENKS